MSKDSAFEKAQESKSRVETWYGNGRMGGLPFAVMVRRVVLCRWAIGHSGSRACSSSCTSARMRKQSFLDEKLSQMALTCGAVRSSAW